jgi:hypothetical protein
LNHQVMGEQAFCIHGHFYQPPRENPLTGEISDEPGASPYPNWNERIFDQCYKPNVELGNFEHISFNIGPTLAEWIAAKHPETLHMLVEQENRNWRKFGVGNGMAQPYHHTILPLATLEDKITQVEWGIADYEFRFGHKPTGLWLPETAVDEETLAVLTDCGIDFTILAPWQAAIDRLDIFEPYTVDIPKNRKITVFFYDQGMSTRVSFDPGITTNADYFVNQGLLTQLTSTPTDNGGGRLLIIASDGELYGHHQPFREKFLAYLVDGAIKNYPVRVSYPGKWLLEHPPVHNVKIKNNTSWSCSHGVTRWMGACDCTPGSEWKAPFRQALNEIAGMVDAEYLRVFSKYFSDPWKVRHHYHHVFLNRKRISSFLKEESGLEISKDTIKVMDLLLAAQFERQRMFTSCGWFFDDFGRIEPQNNVAYAAQAIWLTYRASGSDLSLAAEEALRPVRSWRTGARGDVVFRNHFEEAQRTQLHSQNWLPG